MSFPLLSGPLARGLTLLARRARLGPHVQIEGPSLRTQVSLRSRYACGPVRAELGQKNFPEGPRPPFTGALRKRIVSGFVLKRTPRPYGGCFLAKSSPFWGQGFIRTRPRLTQCQGLTPHVMRLLDHRGSWIPKEAHRGLCTAHDF